ncbi:hypothetical protein BUE80_DR000616 [Diplocarpon rosae]|nr:hypothetical protein BUE80_DR000616 [Diplocarpon rosae]
MSTPFARPDSLEKTHLYYVSSLSGVSTPSSSVTAVSQGTTPSTSVTLLPLTAPKREASNTVELDRAASRSRWILFQLWFNTYRRFFVFVTVLNLVGISMTIAGHFPYAENHLGALVLGNLLAAIMVRNELFLRFLYFIAIYGLRGWAPLWLKYTTVSILQHVGGIHSGCALSAVAWLGYKVVVLIMHHSVQHYSVVATGVITIVFVSTALLSAFPWIRNTHHNLFERYHRFCGWLGLAATWSFVILGNLYDTKRGQWRTDANTLLDAQELWFCIFMTVFIFLPWFTVRKVPVEVEIPSSKVAVLRFERGMQQGLLGRIGRGSIMEYHAFGIISEGRKSPYHYMICGVQGDFTKNLVANPPQSVWTRQLKFAGPGHASAMFKRGIRICTGTGLGAALSTCIQSPNW